MKTLLILTFISALALNGCVVHEHGRVHGSAVVRVGAGHVCGPECDHYYHGHSWYRVSGHVHGPGCGHVLRAGVWIPVP